jgi:hypothetical protein
MCFAVPSHAHRPVPFFFFAWDFFPSILSHPQFPVFVNRSIMDQLLSCFISHKLTDTSFIPRIPPHLSTIPVLIHDCSIHLAPCGAENKNISDSLQSPDQTLNLEGSRYTASGKI